MAEYDTLYQIWEGKLRLIEQVCALKERGYLRRPKTKVIFNLFTKRSSYTISKMNNRLNTKINIALTAVDNWELERDLINSISTHLEVLRNISNSNDSSVVGLGEYAYGIKIVFKYSVQRCNYSIEFILSYKEKLFFIVYRVERMTNYWDFATQLEIENLYRQKEQGILSVKKYLGEVLDYDEVSDELLNALAEDKFTVLDNAQAKIRDVIFGELF